MNEAYLPKHPCGRWAISRTITGKSVCLVENSHMDFEEDIALIFTELEMEFTQANLDLYFPILENKGRCPTLPLLNMFVTINQTVGEKGKTIGV